MPIPVIVRDRDNGIFHAAYFVGDEPYIADRCAVQEYDVVPWTVTELAEPESLHACLGPVPEPAGEDDE